MWGHLSELTPCQLLHAWAFPSRGESAKTPWENAEAGLRPGNGQLGPCPPHAQGQMALCCEQLSPSPWVQEGEGGSVNTEQRLEKETCVGCGSTSAAQSPAEKVLADL